MRMRALTDCFVLRPRSGGRPLARWLHEEIRAAIVEGRLSPGSRLPSTRALAGRYQVARGTVVAAFDQLVREGYLESCVGSGTYVRAMPVVGPAEGSAPRALAGALRRPRRLLSARGRRLAAQALPEPLPGSAVESSRLDRPLADAFPTEAWNRLAARLCSPEALGSLELGEPFGYAPLRESIAGHIAGSRGVRCTPEQVVVTCGPRQSLDLVANLLLDPGDRVWMEDPGHASITSLLRAYGAEVIGPVDARGPDCAAGRQPWRLARLAYARPACQVPPGMPMSQDRHLKLLQWANEAGAWIFEDDYGGPPQSDRPPPRALYSLDRAGSVIYCNSFGRMPFPSLRLGFLVLPSALIEAAAAALSVTQPYRSMLEQAILADFVTAGHFEP